MPYLQKPPSCGFFHVKRQQGGVLAIFIVVLMLLVVMGLWLARAWFEPSITRPIVAAQLRNEVQSVFQAHENVLVRQLDRQGLYGFGALVSATLPTSLGKDRLRADMLVGGQAQTPVLGQARLPDGQRVWALILGPVKNKPCTTAPLVATQTDAAAFMAAFKSGTGVVVPDISPGCVAAGSNIFATWVLSR